MKNSEEPINPVRYRNENGYIQHDVYYGLTKREHFALHLMSGLISNADRHSQEGDCQVWNYEHLSKISINAAEQLLKELENDTN